MPPAEPDEQSPIFVAPLARAIDRAARDQLRQRLLGRAPAGPIAAVDLTNLRQLRRVDAGEPEPRLADHNRIAVGDPRGTRDALLLGPFQAGRKQRQKRQDRQRQHEVHEAAQAAAAGAELRRHNGPLTIRS